LWLACLMPLMAGHEEGTCPRQTGRWAEAVASSTSDYSLLRVAEMPFVAAVVHGDQLLAAAARRPASTAGAADHRAAVGLDGCCC
jgi:hypothetical protein